MPLNAEINHLISFKVCLYSLSYHSIYRPGYSLNQFIDLIWVANSENLALKSNHHAAMFTELIFNYGHQFQIEGENVEGFMSGQGHHIISGLKTRPFQTTVSGKHLNVGFILKPHCYGLLLEQLGSREMQALSEAAYEELVLPDTPRFKKIEPMLIQFFGLLELDSDLVKFENHISAEFMKNGALRNFNNLVSTTQKSFIKKFKRLYFLTPSEYIRLKQTNCAALLIQKNPGITLTQAGLESGFYDQSHFIRVFKKHHGFSPKIFKRLNSPAE